MNKEKRIRRPVRSSPDIAHHILKATLSTIPVVGGAAAELFSTVIAPPIVKRRDDWLNSIAEELKSLEDRFETFKVTSLSQNEVFISTFIRGTQGAVRNHSEEKLEALRNAVLNTALEEKPIDYVLEITFNLIDKLTPLHIKLLKFFSIFPCRVVAKLEMERDDDYQIYEEHIIEYDELIQRLFPNEQLNFWRKAIIELETEELIKINDIESESMMLHSKVYLTDFGESFLRFITHPLRLPIGPRIHVSDDGWKDLLSKLET